MEAEILDFISDLFISQHVSFPTRVIACITVLIQSLYYLLSGKQIYID